MNDRLPEEDWFDELAAEPQHPAPSRLKSRIYSSLIRRQQESGGLEPLPATKQAGSGLCVFEELVRIAPVGEKAKRFQCCSVCHARVLAERFENAPIYWRYCPYVQFQGR